MAEIVGTLDNDDLSGTSDDDLINGGLGNDTLRGLEGNDTLVGGNETSVGATLGDFYFGGAGEDTVDYSSYSGKVAVVLLDGYPPQGRAEGSTYDSIENLIGTAFDDLLTGDDFDNKIYGGAGQDAINGGAGDDFIVGGPGKEDAFNVYGDQLSGGPGEDTVSYETSGAGVTIFLGLNYSFNHGGDAESDILGTFEIVIGSAFNDTITADNARNTLYGGDGNDALNGETGDDRLYGGDGNDMLDGGAGNDIFGGDTGADSFTGYYGNDTADYSDSGAAVQVDLSNRVGNGGDAAGDTYGVSRTWSARISMTRLPATAPAIAYMAATATTRSTAIPATIACTAGPATTCSAAGAATTSSAVTPAPTASRAITAMTPSTIPTPAPRCRWTFRTVSAAAAMRQVTPTAVLRT